jgi:hypothetical protein
MRFLFELAIRLSHDVAAQMPWLRVIVPDFVAVEICVNVEGNEAKT